MTLAEFRAEHRKDIEKEAVAKKARRSNSTGPQHYDKHRRPLPTRPSNDTAVQRFVGNVDLDLLEYLLGRDGKYASFITALHDPIQSRLTFAGLMKRYNISLHELHMVYMDGKRHLGLIKMSNNVDQVMEDISRDALSHWECCQRCDGQGQLITSNKAGQVTSRRQCPVCRGKTQVLVPGDKDARQQTLEAVKVLGKSPTQFVVQQNFGAALEDQLAVTQRIIMGDKSQ